MSRMRSAALLLCLPLASTLAACGGDDDGGGGADGGTPADPCGFGVDDYLPYEAGFTWSYRVTDLGTGARETKEQRIDPGTVHEEFGEVVEQVTSKANGETVSLLRKEGDRVLRFQQEDFDTAGTLERTTVYDPAQIRIDESSERTTAGATWQESYTEIVTEPALPPVETATLDDWEVVADDVECDSPLGTFRCLHLRRTRTQGGVAVKDFFFARGVGKVREAGSSQLEELTACGE